MLAYNLMNLFKELVLGQRDKKRMGKWIRQRFLSIAGRLVTSGRRLILKLQEDWVYREEYNEAEGRLERLAWVTRERKKKKGCKKNRGAKAFNGVVCSIYRKCIEIMVLQARRMGEEPFLFIEKAIGNEILLDLSSSLQENNKVKSSCIKWVNNCIVKLMNYDISVPRKHIIKQAYRIYAIVR
jgi:hypothetical protein